MFSIKRSSLAVLGAAVLVSFGQSEVKAGVFYTATHSGQFASVDTETGSYTELFFGEESLGDIAIDANGNLWGSSYSGLYQIDMKSGLSTRMGDTPYMVGLGFDDGGTLFGAAGSDFYSIDTVTGSHSLVSSIGGFTSSGDVVYDASLGLFWATSVTDSGTDSLWQIAKDGISKEIGNTGYGAVYGLAFGDDGTLFGYTGDGTQISLNLETGAGTFESQLAGVSGTIWGAASDPTDGSEPDLTPEPQSTPEPSAILGIIGIGVLIRRKSY